MLWCRSLTPASNGGGFFASNFKLTHYRFFCIGAVGLDVYYVTYTVLDDDRTRIISARPATKRETNAYYRGKTGG